MTPAMPSDPTAALQTDPSAAVQAPTPYRFVPSVLLYGLIALGLLLPLGLSLVPGLGLLVWLAGLVLYDLVLAGLTLWDFRRSCQWQFDLSRTCEAKLSIGRQNRVDLQVTVQCAPANATTLLQLCDRTPESFARDQDCHELVLAPPAAASGYTLTYHVLPPQRGQYQWRTLQLRFQSPWGLSWCDAQRPLETAVEVYPDLIGLRQLSIRLSLESTGTLQRRHRIGGTEFAELRDYAVGDDVRLMDWKASARRQRPVVRLLEPERDQPLIILLDRGRLMTAQVEGLTRFDWALNATLSLAMAGLRRGDRVAVAVFDKTIHTWIGPQPGMSHLAAILEALTPIEPIRAESDYVAVTSQVLNRYTRRALVVMITDFMDDIASQDLLVAMSRLRPRFLPLCVALRDPTIDGTAERVLLPSDLAAQELIPACYRQAVALDLMGQRRLVFAKLKQQGTLVVDAPAHQVSIELVERYLQLKGRGLL